VGLPIAAVVQVMSFAISVGRASSRAAGTAKPIGLDRLAVQPARGKTLAPLSGKKFIADAVDGEEMFGSVPVVAEFLSQLNDDLVESAGGAEITVTPDVVEQAVARKNFARMSREELKQFELFCSEFLDPFAAAKLKSFRINGNAADMEDVRTVGFDGRSCAGAAEERVNSGEQLANAEGLGDIVVSAEVQSDDFVDFLTFRSQHEDGRCIFFGAELFAYVVPAGAGEHDIEDDESGMTPGYSIDGFITAVADGDVKTIAFHDFFESEEDMRIIFDDENPGFHKALEGRSVKALKT
jgi:hypothetical protein